MLTRYASALGLGAVMTFGLIWWMQAMIADGAAPPLPKLSEPAWHIARVVEPPRPTRREPPPRPEPPPDQPETDIDIPAPTTDSVIADDPVTPPGPPGPPIWQTGRWGPRIADNDYVLIESSCALPSRVSPGPAIGHESSTALRSKSRA